MANKSVQNVAYHANASAKCLNCGSEYSLGLTTEKINLEICANCHPFYTGQETLVDTAGRIEKFQTRLNKAQSTVVTKKTKSRKLKVGLADVMTDIETNENNAELTN
jgi:large subunit ribosomal protein L31